jgi:DNA-binding NtrC family response regulator
VQQPAAAAAAPGRTTQPARPCWSSTTTSTCWPALHRLFRRDGYQILTAATPAEGFELLALHAVQVIVCDQRMPGMSGTEFLEQGQGDVSGDDTHHPVRLHGLEAVLDSINRGAIYRFYTKPWTTPSCATTCAWPSTITG